MKLTGSQCLGSPIAAEVVQDLPYSSWDVDQSIRLVQEGKCVLVSMHEPLLDLPFPQREENAQQAVLLRLQNRNTMRLCNIPDTALGK